MVLLTSDDGQFTVLRTFDPLELLPGPDSLRASVECECEKQSVLHTHTHDSHCEAESLDSATLGRTAAVVRNRRNVANGADVDAGGRESADGGFATRTGAGDAHVDGTKSVIASGIGCVLGGLLGREGSSLTRTTEAKRSG